MKIAIVIDDTGNTSAEQREVKEFLSLGIPITFAVLPGRSGTAGAVQLLQEKKIPYLLHMPMQPLEPTRSAGEGTLFTNMSNAQIEENFLRSLKEVGAPVGVSNHMGAGFTEDYEKMKFFLGLVKSKNLFFFDSLTTGASVGRKVAKELGMKCFARDTFLTTREEDVKEKQIPVLLNLVKQRGYSVAIGHIGMWYVAPITKVFREAIPEITRQGVEFVYLKDLMESTINPVQI
jgi:hypothetical protein